MITRRTARCSCASRAMHRLRERPARGSSHRTAGHSNWPPGVHAWPCNQPCTAQCKTVRCLSSSAAAQHVHAPACMDDMANTDNLACWWDTFGTSKMCMNTHQAMHACSQHNALEQRLPVHLASVLPAIGTIGESRRVARCRAGIASACSACGRGSRSSKLCSCCFRGGDAGAERGCHHLLHI